MYIEHNDLRCCSALTMAARSSPLRRAVRGAVAGVAGTLALDLVNYWRARREGSEAAFLKWEIVGDLERWEDAPAPGQVARKALAAVTGEDPPVAWAGPVSNLTHWAYGTTWGAVYALACPALRPWWAGPTFGAAVWSSDYVTLPLAGVYEPIWKYDLPTLWDDLSAHLAFGTGTDVALRLLLCG
jgi:hypothetical protein